MGQPNNEGIHCPSVACHTLPCRLHGLFIHIFKADDLSYFAEGTSEIHKSPYELLCSRKGETEIFSMEVKPVLPGKETPTALESAENLCHKRCEMEIGGLEYMYVKVSRTCLVVLLLWTEVEAVNLIM